MVVLALNKIKNFLSGMKYKKTQEEHLQEAKIARKEEEQQKGVHVEEEDEAISIEEDLESEAWTKRLRKMLRWRLG